MAKLVEQIQEYLANKYQSSVQIQDFASLSGGGGACQDNYRFDLQVEQGELAGEHQLVLRTDKGGSLFSSLSKEQEFGVCSLAYANGVKTPRPYLLEKDTAHTGNPFFIMQRIAGKANGRFVVKDRSLQKARKQIVEDLARNLAQIHTIKESANQQNSVHAALLRSTSSLAYAQNAVKELQDQVKNLNEPHPAIELCLHWAEKNAPETGELVLVHGDFRTGNFMVSPSGLDGILDWEFSHWGDPCEDIGWLCMRDWRFGKLNLEAGGLAKREDFYQLYAEHTGKPVATEKVRFWEVIGNLRWAVGSIEQAERHLSGVDKGIELAAIGRRTSEMEYEAMRLVENAV
ncbi:MAG: phosphotransferase family protein [Spirochaetota bacterium]